MDRQLGNFASPPKEYSAVPLWFWNGRLEKEELVRQIDEMCDKGVYGAFMHPRAYLITAYLEDEWWDAVSACVKRGRESGFHPWLYDEYAWPSGTAGSTFAFSYQKPSRVLAQGEQNMAKGLRFKRYAVSKESTIEALIRGEAADFIAAFKVSTDGNAVLAAANETVNEGEALVFFKEVYPLSVDYLNKDTIKYFIELTHEEYKKRYGDYFGNVIPGVFFDEIYMAGNPLPWTDNFPAEFKKRRGYDILPNLPALVTEGAEEYKQIRGDYFKVLAELYEEGFFIQIAEWCEKNHLYLTGHTEENLSGHPCRQGNYFNTVRRLHIPGADCHDYRYRFPRKITCVEPKYSVSVARAYNKPRAMSEAMGGAGWGCSLQQFKRGINTMAAMGISMFTLHGFYYESEHQGSQADWPTSFFFQNPYWKYFKHFSTYINRISYMNAIGNAVVETGLFYPIYDMQVNTISGAPNIFARNMSDNFHKALYTLLERQIDTDLIDIESLVRGEVSDGVIKTGRQRFKVLLFPWAPPDELTSKLKEFIASGGSVLFYYSGNDAPQPPKDFICPMVKIDDIPETIDAIVKPDILVLEGSRANLYTCHRRIDGEDIYYISNSSPKPRELTLQLRGAGIVQKMDIETGETFNIPSKISSDNKTILRLRLGEDEACYLRISRGNEAEITAAEYNECEEIALSSRWNFLPLDASFDSIYRIDAKSTELQIPLADFASDLHDSIDLIRICNLAGEPGYCGRYLSLWKGKWIARRPSWRDGADRNLYFRKIVDIKDKPEKALLCAAAINHCVIYVNGIEACKAQKAPVTTDISALLKKGSNLIAAHVQNDEPENTFTAVHELPADHIIAFLCEVKIVTGNTVKRFVSDNTWIVNNSVQEDWLSVGVGDPVATIVDPTHNQSFGEGDVDGKWLYAWERGKPPLHPWGDLPLFGKQVTFPRRLNYGINIPAGTTKIKKPHVRGAFNCTFGGRTLNFDTGWAAIENDARNHYLDIRVDAENLNDGLNEPLTVIIEDFNVPLADWRLYGYSWFSGRARYENTVYIDRKAGRYIIDLGQVCFSAEIWVNGVLVGVRIWSPYHLDITGQILDGENRISVIAANSAAVKRRFMLVDEGVALGWNRYWNEDNIDREAENLVSGLLGPVRIYRVI